MILSVCSLFVGVLDIRPSDLLTGSVKTWEIFLISRLPRLLAILCTGIGMSVAGLIMQQLCMNKFVSPTTGATISSAQFGILLALLFAPGSTLWGRAAFSFVCAVLGTWVFVWFIQRIQFKDVVMVPLVGIMFSNIVMGVTNYLAYKYEMTQALSSWLVGHFSTVIRGRYELVWLTVPLVVLAFVFANHFNIVGMGKDFSQNLGVPYDLVLFMGLTIAAMITASVVVVVGSISYIGLIVPNIVAMFKGDQIRGTLVDTALFGAVFVLICDMIGRVVIYPYELPIELIVGVIGSMPILTLRPTATRLPSSSLWTRIPTTSSQWTAMQPLAPMAHRWHRKSWKTSWSRARMLTRTATSFIWHTRMSGTPQRAAFRH